MAEEGIRGAASLAQLRARPDRVLVLLRLGDAFADVAAGSLTTYLAYQFWGIGGVAIAIAVVALLVVYFGELLPIGLAANRGLPFALALAPTLLLFTRLLAVPLAFLAKVARIRVERRGATSGTVTETDIREMTALGHTEGAIEEHERELIERAFRLDETKTWDIMTPRVDIYAWRDSLRLQDIASSLGTVQYSRVPVYRESVDDITGVLYVRDAYQALLSGQRDVPLRALAREPLIVPGSVALTKLLRDFQNRRIHLAIVVDEYGGTDGLVTLEDVIEERVGEIEDETDVSEDPIIRISRNEIVAVGDVDLREVNHFFNTTLPQLEHRSLNGYLLEELGRVPETGETLERDGISIEVLDATDTQVTRVRMRRSAPQRDATVAARDGDAAAAGQDVRPDRAATDAVEPGRE
jgi:putative hemolysin